jgi:rare lipoprotein A
MIRVPAVLTLALSLGLPFGGAEAKTPGKTYCFNGTCHTVKTLDETRRLVGVTTTVKASFYDDPKHDRFNPSNLTSSGEYFRAWKADNAASPIYPNGTKLLVWHPGNRKTLTVRVNNAGPYWGDRKLDLSRAAAEAIGMGGVATLQVRVLEAPSKAEATYSKGRTYAPVKGYMGQFASLDAAVSGASSATRLASNDVTPKKDAPKQDQPQKVAAVEALKTLASPKPAPVKVAAITSPVGTPPAEKKAVPVRVASVERAERRNPLAEAVGFAAERAERDITASILHRNDRQ